MNGLPFEFILVILSIFIVLTFLIVLAIIYGRGDVIRLWIQPVRYFRNIKHTKPIRVKVRHRGIAQTLNDDLVKLIDHVIFKTKKVEGNPSETVELDFDHKQDNVPESVCEAWKIIREHPEKYTIWGTSFTRPWRINGQKGRWVFMYHLFPLEEMTNQLGRHKLVKGLLLENPMSVHTPPTKEQFIHSRINEERGKGFKPTRERIKVFEAEYKRLVKEKWLNVVFHPTLTVSQEAQVTERLSGFEKVMSVNAHAMNVLGSKLAKFDSYERFVLGFEQYMRESRQRIHQMGDKLGTATQLVQDYDRFMKELRIPTVVSPMHAPSPVLPLPVPEAKPSRITKAFEGINEVDVLNWLLIGLGLFATILGYGMYVSDAKMWGGLVVGAFLFLVGVIIMVWRKRTTVKIPESIKEAKEEVGEVLRGD